MDTKGGRVSLEINGRRFSVRASAKVMPSTVELENGANMDGSGYSTTKPVLAKLDITFDRGPSGINWTDAFLLQKVNITFQEDDVRATHLFTGGRFSGRPEIDTATGEVSGLSVETDTYQVV